MVTSARLSGDGALIAASGNLPVRYTLVITLGGRRRSAMGVVDGSAALLDAAMKSPGSRLRLDDGTELRVALRRRTPDGPVWFTRLVRFTICA